MAAADVSARTFTAADRLRLLALARRRIRGTGEAEDLVQEALLAAVAAGRTDGTIENLRWMGGIIRNKARESARAAVRRHGRERQWHDGLDGTESSADPLGSTRPIDGLPPSLRVVAALALGGHTRREIASLLRLTDAALRQRVVMLKRALRRMGVGMPAGLPGLSGDLDYGRLRRTLERVLARHGGVFASHDPDGHLFVVTTHKSGGCGNSGHELA